MEIHSETIQSHYCCLFSTLFSGFKALNIWLLWLWMDSFPSGQYRVQSPLNRPVMNWTTVSLILWLQRQLSVLSPQCCCIRFTHDSQLSGPHVLQSHASIVLCAGTRVAVKTEPPLNTEDRKCSDGIAIRFLFITCLR